MLKTPVLLRLFATVIVAVLAILLVFVDRATANSEAGRSCAVPPAAAVSKIEEPIVIEPEPVATPPLVKLGSEAVGTTLTLKVTGYTSTKDQTDDTPCVGSDLTNICELKRRGELICAASREFPLGTKLKIKGLGTCTVRDWMPAHRRLSADWYFGQDAPGKTTLFDKAMRIDKKIPRQAKIVSIPK